MTSKQRGEAALGWAVKTMVREFPKVTEQSHDLLVGQALQRCAQAALKGALYGSQSTQQIPAEVWRRFRANFNRQAKRELKW